MLRRCVLSDTRIQTIGILIESNCNCTGFRRARTGTARQQDRAQEEESEHLDILTTLTSLFADERRLLRGSRDERSGRFYRFAQLADLSVDTGSHVRAISRRNKLHSCFQR